MRYLIYLTTIIFSLILFSCSDQSTGTEDAEASAGEGTMVVNGAIEAEHEGISWYAGLKMDGGAYANFTLHISDVPPGETQENTFGLSIRMVGEDGPFNLTTGEFQTGHDAEDEILIIATYNNKEGTGTASFSTSQDATGTVTIHSISDTSVEASFDVTLEAGPSTDNGFVTITGSLDAKCITAEAGGIGC